MHWCFWTSSLTEHILWRNISQLFISQSVTLNPVSANDIRKWIKQILLRGIGCFWVQITNIGILAVKLGNGYFNMHSILLVWKALIEKCSREELLSLLGLRYKCCLHKQEEKKKYNSTRLHSVYHSSITRKQKKIIQLF